jgi:hypothetical protein
MIALKIGNLDLDKKIISKLFGISDVTITKTYKKILEYEYIITSNQMTNTILNLSKNQFYKIRFDHKSIHNRYNNQYPLLIKILEKFNKFMNNINYRNFKFPLELISYNLTLQ